MAAMRESMTPSELPDFRWDDLHLFLVAHRTGSLTRAAARCSIARLTASC